MLSDTHQLYWGDAHTNIRPYHIDDLERSFEEAREVLDFWPIAYYAFLNEEINGFKTETERQRPVFLEHWNRICELTRKYNEPGRFICFPGYEWHGDRPRWGDHNVFYPTDDAPLDDAETLPELYEHLRRRNGLAIPHHTAYEVKRRGKDWDVHDEHISPFSEIYSGHGCSEGYGSPLLLHRNEGLGPLAQVGSAQAGLARGLHFGFIASGDIHNAYPNEWGKGTMACYARDLTRESLWDAFRQRSVYAVTGDRIRLDFEVAGHNMGSVGTAKPPYRIKLNVEGLDGLARVELLRNNEVIRVEPVAYRPTSMPTGTGRYKFRALFGWGRRRRKHEGIKEREWDVRMDLEQGELVGMEKLWMRFGQKIKNTSSHGCHLHLTSGVSGTAQSDQAPFPGMVFEIKGTPETRIHMTINGLKHTFTLRESRAYPTVIGEIEECEQFIEDRYGVTRADLIESQHDINEIWHEAYKTHVWPAVHEGEFAGTFEWEDVPEHNAESWYYARVIQNNGQVAWSSPVWVTPEK